MILKQGDLEPAFTDTVADITGVAVDLTDAVSVKMRFATIAGVEVFERDMTIVDADAGAVSYEWQDGDTDNADGYYAEIAVEDPTGRVATYPAGGGYRTIIIEPRL